MTIEEENIEWDHENSDALKAVGLSDSDKEDLFEFKSELEGEEEISESEKAKKILEKDDFTDSQKLTMLLLFDSDSMLPDEMQLVSGLMKATHLINESSPEVKPKYVRSSIFTLLGGLPEEVRVGILEEVKLAILGDLFNPGGGEPSPPVKGMGDGDSMYR